MKIVKTMLLVCSAAAACIVLSACRENEQGRVLSYDKGRYSGKPDAMLSDAARRSIQDRVHYQSGLDTVSGGTPGPSGASSSADVRPPLNAAH